MRILLLGDANSSHVIRWTESLAKKGMEVYVFSFSKYNADVWRYSKDIHIINLEDFDLLIKRSNGNIRKILYLKVVWKLKKIINEIKPDIVHAHYSTSYGLLGALVGFHPYIISVWGSDVFEFPQKSFFHKFVLKFNLFCADRILSTSHIMARETALYTKKDIVVTPFGIDLDIFRPKQEGSLFSKGDIVIGTVKTLEEKYGIDYLIEAFALVVSRNPELSLKLLVVGGGSQEVYLRSMAENLSISEKTVFTGKVPHAEVARYQKMLSIFVSISNSESFGVAVIEASACEKPVVVSNVGGLPEVVEDGITGIIVPPRDAEAAAAAIERLVLDENLRIQMGEAGRKRVRKLFYWQDNVEQMMGIYKELL